MNRRSVLRWLGLAPVAAPAAVAVASVPALEQSVRLRVGTASAGAHIELLPDGRSRVVFDASRFDLVESRIGEAERSIAAVNDGRAHPFAFDGQTLRMPNAQLTTVEQRITAAEGRIGHLVVTSAG